MTGFAHALATGEDWKAVVGAIDTQLTNGSEQTADLGLVYATEALAPHFGDIVNTLRERTGIAHWSGCVGLGICGTGAEHHEVPGLSVLTTPWSKDAYRILDPVVRADAVSDALADDWVKAHGPIFGLAHGDPRNRHLGDIVEALPEAGDGYFVGGLTCLSDTPVQVADQPAAGGLSGVLLGADISVMVTLSQGCSPVGPLHRVTGSERSIVATLDDRPALDVLKDDIGEVLSRDLNRIGGYIHVAMPVTGSDTRDYTVRNLVGIDPNGGMIAVGDNVAIGDTLMFVRRDPQAAEQDFTHRLADLKRRIGESPIKGGLYVSCVARGINMFGEQGREIDLIHEQLGEFPMTGFYANGEICGNRMYGYTGVLSVFL